MVSCRVGERTAVLCRTNNPVARYLCWNKRLVMGAIQHFSWSLHKDQYALTWVIVKRSGQEMLAGTFAVSAYCTQGEGAIRGI